MGLVLLDICLHDCMSVSIDGHMPIIQYKTNNFICMKHKTMLLAIECHEVKATCLLN